MLPPGRGRVGHAARSQIEWMIKVSAREFLCCTCSPLLWPLHKIANPAQELPGLRTSDMAGSVRLNPVFCKPRGGGWTPLQTVSGKCQPPVLVGGSPGCEQRGLPGTVGLGAGGTAPLPPSPWLSLPAEPPAKRKSDHLVMLLLTEVGIAGQRNRTDNGRLVPSRGMLMCFRHPV